MARCGDGLYGCGATHQPDVATSGDTGLLPDPVQSLPPALPGSQTNLRGLGRDRLDQSYASVLKIDHAKSVERFGLYYGTIKKVYKNDKQVKEIKNDEIGRSARSFNVMAEKFAVMLGKAGELSGSMKQSSEDLAQATQQADGTAEEIAVSSQEIAAFCDIIQKTLR